MSSINRANNRMKISMTSGAEAAFRLDEIQDIEAHFSSMARRLHEHRMASIAQLEAGERGRRRSR